jgi:protein ImuB
MRRIISVWFQEFPVERFLRERRKLSLPTPPRGLPFALVEKGPKGLRLSAVNAAARQFGLSPSQRLADARAAVPDLLTEQYEPEKDQTSLLGLAQWMERYSPWVAPDGKDGLLLDSTGVSHLFGGEEQMLRDIKKRLETYGFTARMAVGETIGAAWALARFGGKGTSSVTPAARQLLQRRSDSVEPSLASGEGGPRASVVGEVPLLHPLPIEALRIDADATRTLRRLGLKTIGSLTALPRASLARRFRGESIHENVLLRLDELDGTRHEALNAINPPSSFMAHRALMEPVISHEGLQSVLTGLTHTLANDLEKQNQGALRLILKLFKSDGGRAQIPVGLSAPSHDVKHILRLLLPKLDSLDAGFGIDAMTLEARETGAMIAHQHGFMEDDPLKPLASLNDRVMNREAKGLSKLEAVESHVPERAEREANTPLSRQPAADTLPRKGGGATKRKPSPLAGEGAERQRSGRGETSRPLLIFAPPEPARVIAAVPDGPPMRLTWRRVTRKIVRSQGPERIAPEWWNLSEGERPRDYYHIEDDQGRRYWLYRDGLYGDDDATPPKWFVHGLSA